MEVTLAYGRDGLVVGVPDDAVVVGPLSLPSLPDEEGAITESLRRPVAGLPLAELIRPGARVAVVFPDITRPMPNRTVLPPLLRELERIGAHPQLLCATGTHRPATAAELEELVGREIVDRYDVSNHIATDGDHVAVGDVEGTPVLIDRRYVEADARIVTGFVEPHFFAGFSGGPKAVCPGLAALETTLEAHSPGRIADPASTWGVLDGNPVHEFVSAAAALAPPDFSIDVAINDDRRVTAVFSGELPASHRSACEFVERTSVQRVPGRFDVVLSTNAGYPLDRNLYQAVKGMSAAERVVREGGAIVMAAACADGVPAEGDFGRMLAAAPSAAALADADVPPALDRWQVQVLGRVLGHARVQLYSDGLTDEEIADAHLEPAEDVAAAVAEALARAPGGRLCVLPQGPLTIASPV